MELFRPVGEAERKLIEASGYTAFPPRLPEQPIFYPVLKQQYAEEIASKWNTKDKKSGCVGYVLRFQVEDAYIARFPVQTVGRGYHQELWVPAEELEELNRHIIGRIEVVSAFGETDG